MKQINAIDKEIISYLKLLSDKKKEAVLTIVKTFAEDTYSLYDLMPQEVREDVDRSLEQSKNGEGKKHVDVMKKYDKWLKK